LKIIDFRPGDLSRFGPIPPLPYPCDRGGDWEPGHGGLNAFARRRISGAIYNALYNELHPRGTRRGTRPVAHQSYSDWMCGETPADPIELIRPTGP
jgi:hypothetical protein